MKRIRRRYSEPTRSPHVRLHPNGHVTIAGLNYEHASNILTIARLYLYDHEGEKVSCGCRQCQDFRRMEVWIIETLSEKLKAAIDATHGPRPEPGLKERLRENNFIRQILNDAIREAREERVEQ